MADVVYTEKGNSGNGFLFGVILLIAFVLILFYFGLPIVQRGFGGGNGGTTIQLPSNVNVETK